MPICRDCKKNFSKLHIHHKDRNHKNNASDNIEYLCSRCHGLQHGVEGAEVSLERSPYSLYQLITQKVGYRLTYGMNLLNDDRDSDFD